MDRRLPFSPLGFTDLMGQRQRYASQDLGALSQGLDPLPPDRPPSQWMVPPMKPGMEPYMDPAFEAIQRLIPSYWARSGQQSPNVEQHPGQSFHHKSLPQEPEPMDLGEWLRQEWFRQGPSQQ